VTILQITIPNGVRLPLPHHPVINAGVLLELKPDDPIVEMVNAAHFGESLGPGPATIVVIYAGLEGQPVTVLEGQGSEERAPGGSSRPGVHGTAITIGSSRPLRLRQRRCASGKSEARCLSSTTACRCRAQREMA
jgi:hypothetical protein